MRSRSLIDRQPCKWARDVHDEFVKQSDDKAYLHQVRHLYEKSSFHRLSFATKSCGEPVAQTARNGTSQRERNRPPPDKTVDALDDRELNVPMLHSSTFSDVTISYLGRFANQARSSGLCLRTPQIVERTATSNISSSRSHTRNHHGDENLAGQFARTIRAGCRGGSAGRNGGAGGRAGKGMRGGYCSLLGMQLKVRSSLCRLRLGWHCQGKMRSPCKR
jgi:hypothetical protein